MLCYVHAVSIHVLLSYFQKTLANGYVVPWNLQLTEINCHKGLIRIKIMELICSTTPHDRDDTVLVSHGKNMYKKNFFEYRSRIFSRILQQLFDLVENVCSSLDSCLCVYCAQWPNYFLHLAIKLF